MEREEKEKGRDRRKQMRYKRTEGEAEMKTANKHRNRLMENRVSENLCCSLQRDSDGS